MLFFDEPGYAGLSDTARWYIGGLLAHAPSLLAFTCPTVNSYHRLVPGFEAPVNLVYSQRNRSACIRIPITGPNAKAKRLSSASPTRPATRTLRSPRCSWPGSTVSATRWSQPTRSTRTCRTAADEHIAAIVPGSLPAVLDALEEDHAYLLEGDVFTLISSTPGCCGSGRTIDSIRLRLHPHEFELYYDSGATPWLLSSRPCSSQAQVKLSLTGIVAVTSKAAAWRVDSHLR